MHCKLLSIVLFSGIILSYFVFVASYVQAEGTPMTSPEERRPVPEPAPAPKPAPAPEPTLYSIEEYSKAIAENPKDPAAYFLRGHRYLLDSNYREAIDDFSTAIRLNPKVALFYSARARVYHLTREYKSAVADFTKAITTTPDSPAKLHSMFKKYIDTDLIEVVLSLYPDNERELYLYRAEVYMMLEQYRKAVDDFSKVIRLNPSSDAAYYGRGYSYYEIGSMENAIKDISRAIDIRKKRYDELTSKLEKKSNAQDKSSEDYLKGARFMISLRANELSSTYFVRSMSYYKKGDKQNALSDLDEACSLEQNHCQRRDELKKEIARGEKWVSLGGGGKHTKVFIDTSSIKKSSGNKVKAWFRFEYDDVTILVDDRKERGLSTSGYDLFSHQLVLKEMDCANETMTSLQRVDYADKGTVLNSYTGDDPKPEYIIPDSVGAKMYRAACKEKKK